MSFNKSRYNKGVVAQRSGLLTRAPATGVLVALLLGSCGDEPAIETEVMFLVNASESTIAAADRIHVRVWDNDGMLSRDQIEPIEGIKFPFRLPVAPRGGDGTRRYHAEVEFFDSEFCPFGQAVIAGQFEPGQSIVREVMIDAAPASCRPVFVALDGVDQAGGACEQSDTPCRNLQFAFDSYIESGADIMYVAGGNGSYYGFQANELTPDTLGPLTFRQWPGRGTPLVDGEGELDATLGACCVGNAVNDTIWDGFETVGGRRHGFQLNGPTATNDTLRNCFVHDNGIAENCPASSCGAIDSGIQVNQASDCTIEFNVISDNHSDDLDRDGSEVFAWGIWMNTSQRNRIRFNRIINNEGIGILFNSEGGELRGNLVVGNRAGGVSAISRETSRVEHNAVLRNDEFGMLVVMRNAIAVHNTIADNRGDGLVLQVSGAQGVATDNVIVNNEGFGIRLENPSEENDPENSHNLLFGNRAGSRQSVPSDDLESELEADPLLRSPGSDDVATAPGSPARGSASNGGDRGSVPLTN